MSLGTGKACVTCQTYLATRKNGIVVLETLDDGRPYKVWQADLLECPDCGFQIITGYGQRPMAEHYQAGFDSELQRVEYTIIGCPKRVY